MRFISSTVLLGTTLLSLQAEACPDCAEGIRAQVRAGIFDETFARTLGAAALPFGVLAGITTAIHLGIPSRRRRHG